MAFKHHLPLELRPDDFWILITQAVSVHIERNAEALRSRFRGEESQPGSKKKLTVWLNPEDVGNIDWNNTVHTFGSLIRKNVVASLVDEFTPTFTTTTNNDIVASEVSLMSATQHYFQFEMGITCGYPWVKLHGTLEDWEMLAMKAEALIRKTCLPDFAEEWLTTLNTVFPYLIESYQHGTNKSRSEGANKDTSESDAAQHYDNITDTQRRVELFWRGMVNGHEFWLGYDHHTVVSGWVNAFLPLEKDGETPNQHCQPYTPNENIILEQQGAQEEVNVEDEFSRGTFHAGLAFKNVPLGIVTAPVSFPEVYGDLTFSSGFIGAEQDHETFALRPVVGWYMTKFSSSDTPPVNLSTCSLEVMALKKLYELDSAFAPSQNARGVFELWYDIGTNSTVSRKTVMAHVFECHRKKFMQKGFNQLPTERERAACYTTDADLKRHMKKYWQLLTSFNPNSSAIPNMLVERYPISEAFVLLSQDLNLEHLLIDFDALRDCQQLQGFLAKRQHRHEERRDATKLEAELTATEVLTIALQLEPRFVTTNNGATTESETWREMFAQWLNDQERHNDHHLLRVVDNDKQLLAAITTDRLSSLHPNAERQQHWDTFVRELVETGLVPSASVLETFVLHHYGGSLFVTGKTNRTMLLQARVAKALITDQSKCGVAYLLSHFEPFSDRTFSFWGVSHGHEGPDIDTEDPSMFHLTKKGILLKALHWATVGDCSRHLVQLLNKLRESLQTDEETITLLPTSKADPVTDMPTNVFNRRSLLAESVRRELISEGYYSRQALQLAFAMMNTTRVVLPHSIIFHQDAGDKKDTTREKEFRNMTKLEVFALVLSGDECWKHVIITETKGAAGPINSGEPEEETQEEWCKTALQTKKWATFFLRRSLRAMCKLLEVKELSHQSSDSSHLDVDDDFLAKLLLSNYISKEQSSTTISSDDDSTLKWKRFLCTLHERHPYEKGE